MAQTGKKIKQILIKFKKLNHFFCLTMSGLRDMSEIVPLKRMPGPEQ